MKSQTNNKLVTNTLALLLALVLLALLTTGCKLVGEDKNGQGQPRTNGATRNPEPDLNLALYFVQFDVNDTYLVRETHTIPYEEDVAKAAVQELIRDEKSIFPTGTEVLDVTVENSLATVNFNDKVLESASVGAAGEALGLQSVVNTLTELYNIDKVAFAVEGKSDGRVLDWWGHVGLYEQPFTRDLSMVRKPALWITHPTPNQVIGVPLFVKGSAMVYEGTVNVRVMDDKGNLLVEDYTTATAGAPERGEFEIGLKFDPPSQGSGLVEAFWTNPRDGSILDKVSVPVQWP